MEFYDFEVRAWAVDRQRAAVLVHSSPAGAMPEPDTVPMDAGRLDAFRKSASGVEHVTTAHLTAGGHDLAAVVLTPRVAALLARSLGRIGPEEGLRVRLCLDGALSDLPWEYLVLPEALETRAPGGFLALDARISLVREPPQPGRHRRSLRKKQRLLFYGARLCSGTGSDLWEADKEWATLVSALAPAGAFLETRAVLSNKDDCETALMRSRSPVDIFHYSGHADVEDGRGYLLGGEVDATTGSAVRLYADNLGALLRRMGTTIAVFSACNSASRVFVEPLLQADVPVVVGAQGSVAVPVAIAFCERLYSALAVGLSLDEAVTWARLHLLERADVPESVSWQWGSFIVYMQTPEAVLFPQPRKPQVTRQQDAMREARRVTIINVTQNIASVRGGSVTGVAAKEIATERTTEQAGATRTTNRPSADRSTLQGNQGPSDKGRSSR